MRTNTHKNILTKLLASTALAMIITGTPATVDFDADTGAVAIKPILALAKGGGDSDGDSSGSGSGGSDDGDSSGSGSGGSDDSDSSGSGSDGGDDSDNSGPGSGDDDDHDNSGPGSGDDDDHDNSGPGSGGSQSSSSESGETEFVLSDGTTVEVSGDDIEVEFANGWKEEIEDGQYEMKDPSGNTVVERPATQADRDRLEQFIPG